VSARSPLSRLDPWRPIHGIDRPDWPLADDLRRGVDDLTGRLLYDNEETRAALLEAIDSPRDPETITIEEFLALSSVENIVALQAEAARQGTLLDVLENGYFR
jgi:hypothetical protein